MNETPRVRVLFICTHNSARSQMAEGILRHLGGDRFEVASAGTEARGVRQEAVAVMAERGIDITRHSSKTFARYLGDRWDHVITVCDDAAEACPVFPAGAAREHWSFRDPSAVEGSDEDRLAAFREVRDQIEERIRGLVR
ncbi:MAG: arsenate reductase ArsC [Candidatus Limnocylindrales bacterium]